jgi:signal transduction histidine kinase
VKYCAVTLLLLVFVRPVGIIVGLVWGWKLFRRYSDLKVMPGLRRRWVQSELDKDDRWDGGVDAVDRAFEPDRAASQLVRRLGDDPASSDNLERAREALEGVQRLESAAGGDPERQAGAARRHQVRQVRMDELVDHAVHSLRDRLERSHVEVTREFDSAGVLWADPIGLQQVVTQLIGSAVDAFESAEVRRPRLEILMGENLAGNEVWMRVRHNGPALELEKLHEIVRPFYVPDDDGASSEFRLTLDKREAANGIVH